MDLKQIEYFVRVAELGSFTRAAIKLNVAQPALSRQVRQLEVELRQTLLIRNGRGVTLTDAGQLMLKHGRGILYQVERAREELGRERGTLAGRVVLGLPPSLSRVMTVPLTRSFCAQMPHASLVVCEGLSADMRESLRNGQLDVALLYNPAPSPDIEIKPLFDETLFLVGRHDGQETAEPIMLEELATRPLVIPTRPHSLRLIVEFALGAKGLKPAIRLEIDSVPAILELVADGMGQAVLPKLAVLTFSKASQLSLRPIGRPTLRSRLALVVSAHRPMTLTQQAVIDLLRQTMPKLFRQVLLQAGRANAKR